MSLMTTNQRGNSLFWVYISRDMRGLAVMVAIELLCARKLSRDRQEKC